MDFFSPYKLRVDADGAIPRYFVAFTDGEGIWREIEVKRPIYLEFLKLKKIERNMTRWNERHIDGFEQTEESLRANMTKPPKGLEDEVFDGERDRRLRQAIRELPAIQRRRFALYHEFGLTYEQIGKMEGCSLVAVKHAVDKAKAAIQKKLKSFSE